MNKAQAKLTMYQELNRQAEVILGYAHVECEEIPSPLPNLNVWNISFPNSAPLKEIEVNLMFYRGWLDILAFPHPRMIDENYVLEMVRLVNHLNGFVGWRATNGSFYVNEDDLTVGYSARIDYDYLELLPRDAVCLGVMLPLGLVSDTAETLYQVGRGEISAEDGFQCVMNRWREG